WAQTVFSTVSCKVSLAPTGIVAERRSFVSAAARLDRAWFLGCAARTRYNGNCDVDMIPAGGADD
ncbi:MAG: hypothetical protein AAB289_08465, partial [Chloroflexota bacterium]